MNETYMILILGIIITLICIVIQFWRLAYENGKLEELVKQQEAEIKQLKMRDRD